MDAVISRVRGFSEEWSTSALVKNDASKAGSRREQIIPGLFTASPIVGGKRVLLLDDTFTTGGSLASAAYALKQRGAVSVVGLTFGRQLKAEWRDSKDFVASLRGRETDTSKCVVHGGQRADSFEFLFRQPG